ncbi:MAG: glycosyltransferase family 4 protein [Methanothrix sp.]|mgnify:CR=1 FL=1|jgi:glycosyltransferase involved in cell wall biosynthesis|uniref:glycosyltransferase family 4 protein n=1 Tax=Methanothrix sp. TaxID=90426 RepID=UPI0025F93364|nr:glycosyltransferase family 4 protein [Methanothrix sp.]MCK9405091.1 glycosyltransferase family 4 protein [Methanothrix sp.]
MSNKPNSHLRICIIGNQAFSLLNFRGPLISDIVEKGHEVFALAPDYDEHTRASVHALRAEPLDYSLSRTGMNPLRDAADMLHLTFLLRRLKPDLTFAYSIKPIIYGTLAASLSRVPRRYGLISGLGYVFIPPMGREPFRRKLLRDTVKVLYSAALSNASRAFFQNKDDIEEFLSHDLVAADKVVLIDGTGVDLDYWTPAPPLREPVTFLLAARLLREKGVVEYVKAAKLIRKKYPQTRFILLGSLDTNPGAISRAEIEAWASEGIFKWPGHVQDVRTWLARSSVYVLPSYREGVPRSTQEAMAMARPVITTDAPGCRETVIDGVNGFLVPVGNPEALAATMEKFVLEPDMIERMGQASRRIAEERFDVRKINRIILKEMEIN